MGQQSGCAMNPAVEHPNAADAADLVDQARRHVRSLAEIEQDLAGLGPDTAAMTVPLWLVLELLDEQAAALQKVIELHPADAARSFSNDVAVRLAGYILDPGSVEPSTLEE
jgi:hypothetical protein